MGVRVYADTNFLMALFIKEHPFHELSAKIFKKSKRCYYTILAVEEASYSLKRDYGFSYRNLSDFVTYLLKAENLIFLEIQEQKKLCEKLIEPQEKFKLKSRDGLHYLIMKQNNIKLIATFDGDFISRQKELRIKVL